jgi:hypothetical protein
VALCRQRDGVVRFPYKNGDMKATGKPETIVGRIPWTHHWTRDIAFTPDGLGPPGRHRRGAGRVAVRDRGRQWHGVAGDAPEKRVAELTGWHEGF